MRFGAYLRKKKKVGVQNCNEANEDNYVQARDRIEALIAECKLMSHGDSELAAANLEKLLAGLSTNGDSTSHNIAETMVHRDE